MTIHRCSHDGCDNDAVYGTPECLQHTEPRGAALPVLPSPYTTEPPPKPPHCLCQVVPVFGPDGEHLGNSHGPYPVPELEPAPPTQRGWLGRAIARVFR